MELANGEPGVAGLQVEVAGLQQLVGVSKLHGAPCAACQVDSRSERYSESGRSKDAPRALAPTLNAVTVTKISPMPKI